MIVLPIHKQDEDDDTPQEWSLLELNGELICPKSEPDGESMELGSVEFDAEVCDPSFFCVCINSACF